MIHHVNKASGIIFSLGLALQTMSDDNSEEEEELESRNAPDSHVSSLYAKRKENPSLPDTVKVLTTDEGGKVYLVGTAHFSEKSQEDVSQVVQSIPFESKVVVVLR